MRIAFSGTHRTGKSTLIEHVAESLRGYATVDEPYALLEEDGYEFAHPPSIEDFEAQLERALECVDSAPKKVLLDRSPADFLAYLMTHDDNESFDVDEWRDRVIEAMNELDLVVFVPIETPDRVRVPSQEDRAQRAAVHDTLEALLVDGDLGCEVEVLRVAGSVDARVAQVLARVKAASASRRRG